MSLVHRYILSGCLFLTACQGNQSILNSAGPEASAVLKLWWILFGISMLVFIGVTYFIGLSFFRSNKKVRDDGDKYLFRGMIIATSFTVLLLLVILYSTFNYSRPAGKIEEPAYTIEVIGKKWWWSVRYLNKDGSVNFTTANEIHIPVNQPVLFKLISHDVIHSFWVPNLAGKVDMIPGRVNELKLLAKRIGVFRGQCAEFCGIQHSLMAFFVVVEEQKYFDQWIEKQTQAATPPVNKLAIQGQEVFQKSKCIQCHTVRGFNAPTSKGPDLTHLASRSHLAAATIRNRKGHLAGWIMDPQSIKPGNLMPPSPLLPNELHALLFYLRELK